MLAVSSWTWAVVAALGLLSIGVVIRFALELIARIKDLNKTLANASADLGSALQRMRDELEEANQGLAELRQRREHDVG